MLNFSSSFFIRRSTIPVAELLCIKSIIRFDASRLCGGLRRWPTARISSGISWNAGTKIGSEFKFVGKWLCGVWADRRNTRLSHKRYIYRHDTFQCTEIHIPLNTWKILLKLWLVLTVKLFSQIVLWSMKWREIVIVISRSLWFWGPLLFWMWYLCASSV